MPLSRSLRFLPLLALVLGAACSNDDDPTTPAATVAVTVDPAAITITQGQTATVTVSVARAGSFTSDVALAVENSPTGVAWDFAPDTIAAGVTQSTLTLSAATDATPGTTTLTLRFKGTGIEDVTKTVAVTVVPPATGMLAPRVTGTVLALAH